MPSNLNLDYYYGNEAEQFSFCIGKLGCGKVLDFIGVPYQP